MIREPVKNLLSFDVEEHFHALNFRQVLEDRPEIAADSRVEKGMDRILEILDALSVKATFFILGAVAEAKPSLVRRVASGGHEVASHGMSHRTVHELGPKAFREEAAESRRLLEDLSGQPVRGFRASTFSITRSSLWALDILLEEGYGYDSSIFPVRHDRYGIPDFPVHPVRVRETEDGASLMEFPPLTLALPGMNLPCGGGGYFRLYPFFLTRLAVTRMNRKGRPAVLYLHPWELDPNPPRHSLGGWKTFRHYINISRTGARLKALLRRFPFGPLREAAKDPAAWPFFRDKGTDDPFPAAAMDR